MAGREFVFELFGIRKKVRGPLLGDEDAKEISSYLERVLVEIFGRSAARSFAYNMMKDKALLSLVLKISWDYIKLKRQVEGLERELSERMDEALRLADYINSYVEEGR